MYLHDKCQFIKVWAKAGTLLRGSAHRSPLALTPEAHSLQELAPKTLLVLGARSQGTPFLSYTKSSYTSLII